MRRRVHCLPGGALLPERLVLDRGPCEPPAQRGGRHSQHADGVELLAAAFAILGVSHDTGGYLLHAGVSWVVGGGSFRGYLIVAISFRSMRNNLIVLLADMFNLFEIHPAKCVTCPGPEQVTPGKCRSVGVSIFDVVAAFPVAFVFSVVALSLLR